MSLLKIEQCSTSHSSFNKAYIVGMIDINIEMMNGNIQDRGKISAPDLQFSLAALADPLRTAN